MITKIIIVMIIMGIYNAQKYPAYGCSRRKVSQCISRLKSSHLSLCKWDTIKWVFSFNHQQSWQSSHCKGYCFIQPGLVSRTHGHHMILNDRAAVKGVACQQSAASGVDRRAAGDLRYRLGLDHLGLCKPAMRSWNRSGDWQGASALWLVLVWYGWIYAAWGPPEQHSSEFVEYDLIAYLRYRTVGCYNNRFWTSRRLG